MPRCSTPKAPSRRLRPRARTAASAWGARHATEPAAQRDHHLVGLDGHGLRPRSHARGARSRRSHFFTAATQLGHARSRPLRAVGEDRGVRAEPRIAAVADSSIEKLVPLRRLSPAGSHLVVESIEGCRRSLTLSVGPDEHQVLRAETAARDVRPNDHYSTLGPTPSPLNSCATVRWCNCFLNSHPPFASP
jgi:hypothetical protein